MGMPYVLCMIKCIEVLEILYRNTRRGIPYMLEYVSEHVSDYAQKSEYISEYVSDYVVELDIRICIHFMLDSVYSLSWTSLPVVVQCFYRFIKDSKMMIKEKDVIWAM